ncbi:MAG: hypothetical protein WC044_09270 [Crocinitomicaceae bacterium]
MQYLITNKQGQTVLTNIAEKEILEDLKKCDSAYERVYCNVLKGYRRQGKLDLNQHEMYVFTFSEMTTKIFKYHLSGIKIFGELIDSNISDIKEVENQKTRRLKHNLINHNSNILLELYKLVPQDVFRNGGNHIETIENLLRNNLKKAAFTYLKVLKNSNLMKAEFEVYEMFNTENPYLDFTDHQIHKVIILTLNPFWLDLVEEKVNIIIQSTFEKVNIDYKSVSVALSHLFDNAAKYVMPHSDLNIWFQSENEIVSIYFDMTSLKVEADEVDDIFNESNSGKWAIEADLDGDGIGMFFIRKLINLNEGEIKFQNNHDNKSSVNYNGLPYENNRIIITFKKST